MRMFKRFINNRKSLKRWKAIVKEDRDYDYDFFLVLMEQKLRFMYEHYNRSKETDCDLQVAAEIKEVLDLFDKLNGPYMTDFRIEFHDILKEIFSLVSKNITNWWN